MTSMRRSAQDNGYKPCLTTVDISTVVPPDANVIHFHRTYVAPSLLKSVQVVTAFDVAHQLIQIVINRDFHIIGPSVMNIWYEQRTQVSHSKMFSIVIEW